ncbi:hypothetical protein [Celerinatantimonas yamalensis]|uniref:Uncharacterized protein n=1 Tax=Celerinatantimonas yamalensis TaxID=559956 RepID=A0ABW9G3V4_9GAMM
MTQQDIANLIQEKFKFVETPSNNEVAEILLRLTATTTEDEFRKIVYDVVENTECFLFESIDMSASKNILLQIKVAAGKSGSNGS